MKGCYKCFAVLPNLGSISEHFQQPATFDTIISDSQPEIKPEIFLSEKMFDADQFTTILYEVLGLRSTLLFSGLRHGASRVLQPAPLHRQPRLLRRQGVRPAAILQVARQEVTDLLLFYLEISGLSNIIILKYSKLEISNLEYQT